MTRTVSAKLGGYVALVAGGLLAGLALRRPGLVGLVVPFALWLAAGLATVREPELELEVTADRDRAVEGDEVEVAVRLAAATTVERLEVWLRAHPNLELADGTGSRVLRLEAGKETSVRFRLRCGRWGAYRLGEVQVRCHDRFGLLAFDQKLAAALPLKVYPSPQVLRELLRPTHAQRLIGDQRTRLAGDGVEFAETRPLLPGDPIRHVNWRVSARRGELYVNRHHPERNTDVVLFLDTFAETADERGSTLTLAPLATAPTAGAAVLALGLAAYPPATAHGAMRTLLGLLGVGAIGLLLGGLLARSAAPLPWSVGLLGISAAVAMLAGGAPVERTAPLYGPGLLLAAELAYWAVDRARVPGEPVGVAQRRALLLVAMAVAAAVLALLVTWAGGLTGAATGSEIRALGVGAAVMVTWIVAVLARRAGGH